MDRQDADLRFPDTVFCHALRTGGKPLPGHRWPRKVFDAKGPSESWETTGVGAGAELEVTIPDSIVNGLDPSKVPDHLTYLLREKSYVEEMERKVLADSIAHRKRFMPKADCGSLQSTVESTAPSQFDEDSVWLSEGVAPGPGCAPAPAPAPAAALTLQEQVDAKRREYRESIRKTREMSRRNAKKALKKTGDEVKAKRDRLTEDLGFDVGAPGVPARQLV